MRIIDCSMMRSFFLCTLIAWFFFKKSHVPAIGVPINNVLSRNAINCRNIHDIIWDITQSLVVNPETLTNQIR